MIFIKKNLYLILAVFFTLIAILPLMQSGFFPMHDDEQVARLFDLNYSLQSFHIPPRISQNLGFGYGYPFFNFYPSFVYYLAEVFVLLGFGYITSIKIMIAIGFVLSAAFMYLFTKDHVGELGALVASVLYVYAPYHSLDVYVRGALPEFFSFAFIPAVFWVLTRLSKKQSFGNIILLGIFGCFLMLTHNLVFLMSIPFMMIYFSYTLFKNKNWKSYTLSTLIAGVIAALLSAYFWFPAIMENKYTMVSLLTKELADFKLHFVSVPQFFNSAWGYGGSILGPNDGFSLEIGKIHLILVFIAFLLFMFLLITRKIKGNFVLITFLIMFVISVFLQSYYSNIVWENLKFLSYIQFPWRFMIYAVFTSSFIAGYLFVFKFDKRIKYVIAGVIIVISLVYYGSLFKPEKYLNVSDKDYISKEIIRWDTSIKAFEYVPYGIATKKSSLGTTIVDIEKEDIAKETVTPVVGDVAITNIIDKPQYKKFDYSSSDDSTLQVNTYSFPGWEVLINGKRISYNDKNKLRLITINVPKGSGIVEVILKDTSIRKTANLLSLLGILIVIVLLPIYKKELKYEKIK